MALVGTLVGEPMGVRSGISEGRSSLNGSDATMELVSSRGLEADWPMLVFGSGLVTPTSPLEPRRAQLMDSGFDSSFTLC